MSSYYSNTPPGRGSSQTPDYRSLQPYGEYGEFPTDGPARERVSLWLRMASKPVDVQPQTLQERENIRRNRLTAWILLGLFVVVILLIPTGIGSPSTVIALAVGAAGLIVATILNHAGWTTAAGIFLVVLISAGLMLALVGEAGGIEVVDLPAYDLLVLTVVVAASILPRTAAFIVAFANILLICGDFFLQPKAPDLVTEINQLGAISLLARPIALQVLVAIVAFLWVRGVDQQVRRADRAEEMAELEHTYAQQRQQLEIGVQQILATHVRIANGDYSARAPLSQDHALWQIASSLNNLVSRFRTIAEQANRAGYQLQRTEEETHRLASALRDLQAGRRPIWPAPSRTVVDELLPIFASRDRKPPTLPGGQAWESGTGPLGTMGPMGPLMGQGSPDRFGDLPQGWPSGGGTSAPLTPPPSSPSGWAHMPPRFGPPLTNDASRQQGPGQGLGQGMGQDGPFSRTGPVSEPLPRIPPMGRMPSMGQMPPQMPSMPPAMPPQEAVTPRAFEENWPSLDSSGLDPSNLPGSQWSPGETAGSNVSNGSAPPDDSNYPALDNSDNSDNPWYLPPDE